MYKLYFPADAVECGIWTRWWEQFPDPTEEGAKALERTELWRLLRPHLRPPGRILEAGCGQGEWVRFFSMLGFDAVGLENCRPVIEKARRAFPGIDVREGDVAAMPFEDGYFDAAVSYGVLEHFEDGAAVPLGEHVRVVKPGGHLVVTVPYHGRWVRAIGRYPEGGRGDGNGRAFLPGAPTRKLAAEDLRNPGLISGLPVYEEAAVFHEYHMHEADLARMLGRSDALDIIEMRPYATRPAAILPIAIERRLLYASRWPRLAVRAAERVIEPFVPATWFGTMLLAVCRRR